MRNLLFRKLFELRQNYWFIPSILTAVAVVLGFALPLLDARIGTDWMRAVGVLRPTEVEGARAILTTLAGATLGVAGVAFSITIVAVNFASSNYGPRLIGNFMRDRTNQIVLGILVSTFVYCITVLSTVHAQRDITDGTLQAFVPQISVLFALIMTLVSVGALIIYIHHVPESINIMNLVASIGDTLRRSVETMMEQAGMRVEKRREVIDVAAWHSADQRGRVAVDIRADIAGYLQQVDIDALDDIARDRDVQIVIDRAPGDFLVIGELVMTVRGGNDLDKSAISKDVRRCYTQGANRTDLQDIMFLSDQLVEVLARALSPGVNDPSTAVLCLDWLRAGLTAFASRAPVQLCGPDERVLHTSVTFEAMLARSFVSMRQYVAADTSATVHALGVLADIAIAASVPAMVEAVKEQIDGLAGSADELLQESRAREEVRIARLDALAKIAGRDQIEVGEGSMRKY